MMPPNPKHHLLWAIVAGDILIPSCNHEDGSSVPRLVWRKNPWEPPMKHCHFVKYHFLQHLTALASFKQYIVMGIQQQSITGPEIQVCNAHSGPIGGPLADFPSFGGTPLLRQPGQPYFPSVFLLCSTSIHHYSMISIPPGTQEAHGSSN